MAAASPVSSPDDPFPNLDSSDDEDVGNEGARRVRMADADMLLATPLHFPPLSSLSTSSRTTRIRRCPRMTRRPRARPTPRRLWRRRRSLQLSRTSLRSCRRGIAVEFLIYECVHLTWILSSIRWRNWFQRGASGILLISGFTFLINLGPAGLLFLVRL